MNKIKEINNAIESYLLALDKLKKVGIATNKKDFTSQIGEWLVAEIYKGKRAESPIQEGWDIKVRGKFIQVKSHSKAPTNKNRWSPVSYKPNSRIDEIITLVFTSDYKLQEFYKTPWQEALKLIRKHKYRNVLYWDHQKAFKRDINKLPNQKIISLFKM